MRWFKLAALVILLALLVWAYLYFSGKASYLLLNRHMTIQVNGAHAHGEVLEGRATAVVTRRDPGKEHSYMLFFAGDTDMVGNMGFVVDCYEWVAPRLPLLLETRDYPPCRIPREDGPNPWGWPLIDKGSSMQFTTKEQLTVRINRR